jgi:hypothetical protein
MDIVVNVCEPAPSEHLVPLFKPFGGRLIARIGAFLRFSWEVGYRPPKESQKPGKPRFETRYEFDIIRTTSPFRLDKPRFYLPNPVKARFFSFTPRDVVFVVQASE